MSRRRLSHQQWQRIRGQQTRPRQQVDAAGPEDASDSTLSGRIVAHYGALAVVEHAAGILQRCRLRRNLPPLVCGDRVVWRREGDQGVVVALQERHSLLQRPDSNGRPRPVAANLDQVLIVVAPRPEPSPELIDRYLVIVENSAIPALLVLNKADLLDTPQYTGLRERLELYSRIGYPVLEASTRMTDGLSALRSYLNGRTSILVGQSGVGKSSLVRTLLPGREIRIQALSSATGLGTHTTTVSTLYPLPEGGNLIDSPGVRGLEQNWLDRRQLAWGFIEFRPHLGQCRFGDCSHTVEPGCALIEAVRSGQIAPQRLQSFRSLQTAAG